MLSGAREGRSKVGGRGGDWRQSWRGYVEDLEGEN